MDTLQVIAEPTRRSILELVWRDERTAGEIAGHFDVTFGAVSQHLGKLRSGGLVDVRAEGTRRYYRANRVRLEPFRAMLEAMWASKLDQLAAAVEDHR
ncbi:MAG: ArsR/SmtB family transcription factor [Acidimicrobiia bacterium]